MIIEESPAGEEKSKKRRRRSGGENQLQQLARNYSAIGIKPRRESISITKHQYGISTKWRNQYQQHRQLAALEIRHRENSIENQRNHRHRVMWHRKSESRRSENDIKRNGAASAQHET